MSNQRGTKPSKLHLSRNATKKGKNLYNKKEINKKKAGVRGLSLISECIQAGANPFASDFMATTRERRDHLYKENQFEPKWWEWRIPSLRRFSIPHDCCFSLSDTLRWHRIPCSHEVTPETGMETFVDGRKWTRRDFLQINARHLKPSAKTQVWMRGRRACKDNESVASAPQSKASWLFLS